eukprot:4704683-Amphidinium_carterae.1
MRFYIAPDDSLSHLKPQRVLSLLFQHPALGTERERERAYRRVLLLRQVFSAKTQGRFFYNRILLAVLSACQTWFANSNKTTMSLQRYPMNEFQYTQNRHTS